MAATAITIIAAGDPAAANDGTVYAISGFGAVTQGVADVTGVQGGVKFSIRYVVSGTNTALSASVAESATGYDVTVNLATNGGGTGTSTLNQVIALIAADAVISKIITVSLHAGNDGTGVLVAVGKTSGTGGALPTVPAVQALANLDTSNGNTYVNTGFEILVIDNTDSGPSQVKVTSTDTLTSHTFVVDAAKVASVGPFSVATYGAAPVITGVDTGVKLAVLSGSAVKAAAEAAVAAGTDTTFDSPTEMVAVALAALDVYIDSKDSSGTSGKDMRWMWSLRRDLNRFKRRLGSKYVRHDGQ